jgi:hypothetical protein
MQTQITCPSCQIPYLAEIVQIADVGQNPQIKEALLSGHLNSAQCQKCGAITQISAPLLYHDPEHELFMVHIPIEMKLDHQEKEKIIGRLVQQAMDRLPPEERRGYMLQPQTVLSMQTFVEKVLETEGVTPEMLARQRAQSDLLQSLVISNETTVERLLVDRVDLIDESFFAILRAMKEAAENSNQEETALKLINLQAKLYRTTEVGKRLEKRQQAMNALTRDVRKEGELTPRLLLKHVLTNREDYDTVESIILAGQPAFDYQFFILLSERIEKREKAGRDASQLLVLREKLVQLRDDLEKRSREQSGRTS